MSEQFGSPLSIVPGSQAATIQPGLSTAFAFWIPGNREPVFQHQRRSDSERGAPATVKMGIGSGWPLTD